MNILQNNPYRTLGVYSNSHIKERLANRNRMKAFLKVGKPVAFPLDLPQYMAAVDRTAASVEEAEAELALPKDQVFYAQFWFVKLSPLDEVAFNNLLSGDMGKAEEIWQKRPSASSLQNSIVCALIRKDYACAVRCAEALYGDSRKVGQLVSAVLGDAGCSFPLSGLQNAFVDALSGVVGAESLIPIIENSNLRVSVVQSATGPLFKQVESAIAVARMAVDKGYAGLRAGRALMNETRDPVSKLKELVPANDIHFQAVMDKLSQELSHCAILYHNHTDDDDAPHKALPLLRYALSVAISAMEREKCKKDILTLERMERKSAVRGQIERIEGAVRNLKLDRFGVRFGGGEAELQEVTQIVKGCASDLADIKAELGGSSEQYAMFSSLLAAAAVNAVVRILNLQQDQHAGDVTTLRHVFSSGISTMEEINGIHMDAKVRKYFDDNFSVIKSIYERLSPINILSRYLPDYKKLEEAAKAEAEYRRKISGESSGGACYVATMAYGDYDHPQVVILRHFRDRYLSHRDWGRRFINTYYRYSPRLVEKLKGHSVVNRLIRGILDGFISCIRNKYE